MIKEVFLKKVVFKLSSKDKWQLPNDEAKIYKVKQGWMTLFKAFTVKERGKNSFWTQPHWNKKQQSF